MPWGIGACPHKNPLLRIKQHSVPWQPAQPLCPQPSPDLHDQLDYFPPDSRISDSLTFTWNSTFLPLPPLHTQRARPASGV